MSNSTNITTTAIVDNNNNSSETKSDKIIQTTASIDELIYGLYHITMEISPTCRQAATLFLSGFFVVGVLLIIPALMQTAAAYVWAAQIRRESVTPTQLQQSKKNQSISKNNSNKIQKQIRKHRLPKQDRTLFLYRILACTASLLVLIFSTLPQLVIVVAKPQIVDSIDKRWGWCHAFVYADHVTRCFASYLIVIPFLLLFWNFLFSEILPHHHLIMRNVFEVILKSSIIIALFSLCIPIPIVIRQYERMCTSNKICLCGPTMHGIATFIYYDFVITRIIPAIFVIFISIGFIRWLPREDYGVFYEPTIFLAFMIPHVLCEVIIHIFHRAHIINKLINVNFSNFMLLSYALYHMSFSCTFVLATLRSMLSEIQEERRKRSMLLYDETTHDSSKQQSSSSRNKTTIRIADNNNTTNQMHGTKRRTNLIHGLQKQFSVAYRWKPDFTDEETGFISGQLDELSMEQSTNQNISSINDNESNVFDIENETNEKCTDDAMLHYAILQRSASLKRKEQEQRIKPQINTSYNIMRNLNTQQHQPKQQHTILYSINN
uniref:RGS domain-containing protein n=1 Tax=Schistosoma mansoni TaxID=6183 RepID=A0A3Q0KLE2_SCHMA